MSNRINFVLILLFRLSNQLITWLVLVHWFIPVCDWTFLFMFSVIALLIRPSWFFAGFITRHSLVLMKLSLWSFAVMKQFGVLCTCILSFSFSLEAISLVSMFMASIASGGAFCTLW